MDKETKQAPPPAVALRYVDRPDLAETFADSVNTVTFDGQSLRIELGVTRLDEIKPGTLSTGRRYPASRLVLSLAAAIDLINRMQQMSGALAQAGVVKVTPPMTAAAPTAGPEKEISAV